MRATSAPLTLDGATFDAPASCQLTGGALVCKEDGQQLELWVYRTPLKAASMETLANKMSRVAETHQAALKNISGNAGSAASSSFSSYGNYAVNGSRIAGKGVVSAPSVALATLLNGDDIFQIIEVVAQRTPRIEALTAALQRSLKLPDGTASVISEGSDAAVAGFSGKLLTFQHPNALELVVIEDTATALSVGLRHKARSSGPNVTIQLRAAKDATTPAALASLNAAAAAVVAQRKQQSLSAMLPGSATVDIAKMGAMRGTGYALIGTPDAKKGFSGIESIETMFAAELGGRLLEVRLTGEQQYADDVEQLWLLLSKSLKLTTP